MEASKRLPGHSIFHCPVCGADRVGEIFEAPPILDSSSDLTGRRPKRGGPRVQCTGCRTIHDAHGFDPTPRHPEFEARFTECARYLLVTVAASGDPTNADVRRTAIEHIRQLGRTNYSEHDFDRDVGDGDLDNGLRGSLLVVAEDLDETHRTTLLGAAVAVAQSGGSPSTPQVDVIVGAALVLGVPPLKARLLATRGSEAALAG